MKKVILVSYYWPPAGGPGVQRWLKFTKYFADYDLEPIVVVPDNPSYPTVDESLIEEVPSHIRVIRIPISEPYGWARIISSKKTKALSKGLIERKRPSLIQRLLLYVRGNFFIPDARKSWVKPVVRHITGLIKEEGIDLVITTGPPHSVHLIGKTLKASTGICWMADFRDPWTTISYHKDLYLSKRAIKKHEELENSVLTGADHLMVTSFKTQREFQNKTKVPVTVITNGFDCGIAKNEKLEERFTITHTGSLLSGRNPEMLWNVLYELCKEIKGFQEDLSIHLVGNTSEEIIRDIGKKGMEDNLILTAYLPHEDAVQAQRRAQLLLLVEIDSGETNAIIPGKLFEYMAAMRPVLAIGPPDWDAGELIIKHQAGKVFTHSDKVALKEQLIYWYQAYANKNLVSEARDIERYSRKNLTGELSNVLRNICLPDTKT